MDETDPESTAQASSYEGPAHASPYPLSRLSAPIDLVDVAREIQKADAMLTAVAGNQLQLIADQIRALQDQARAVLERTRRDAELHRARCTLQKRIGQTYHLYREPGGDLYFSLLSPEDWRGSPPHPFEGSFRLEADMTWTPAASIPAREARAQSARRLLGGGE